MAGKLLGSGRGNPDVLFDLTPDDNTRLQESDLIQLVNYGQLQKPVKVQGTDGRVYTIEMALLWDEDYTEILKLTSHQASDMLLRSRTMRKLRLHRAIQKIDTHDYSDKTNVEQNRELWTILSRMADKQVERLAALYDQIELERDLLFLTALKQLTESMDSTMPKDIAPSTPKKDPEQVLAEHLQVFQETGVNKQEVAEKATEVLIEQVEGKAPTATQKPEPQQPVARSPKQVG